jgi:D-alanyl-D-alanine carboxypeptidase/D-alanyl-D-alanine-endopeptidase (penicillin-binding protein 4)
MRPLGTILFISFVFLSIPSWSQGAKNQVLGAHKGKIEQVRKILNDSKIPKNQLGVYIASARTNTSIAEINSEALMNPASVTKLITAGAVLNAISPGFRFITRLTTDGQQSGSSLLGNIFLQGVGDPSLDGEGFWQIANGFNISGNIKEVKGNLVVDDSHFERYQVTKPITARFGQTVYPITGALAYSNNQVGLYINAMGSVGSPPTVNADFNTDYVRIIINAKIGPPNSADNIVVTQALDPSGDFETFTISGSISQKFKRDRVFIYFMQPDIAAGYALKKFLEFNGIKVLGKVVRGSAPKNPTRILGVARSEPIEDIVADMDKDSNNFYADMLTQELASIKSKVGLRSGIDRIQNFYSELRPALPKISLISPSGFSRENRVSAKGIWQFLNIMQNNPRYSIEFMRSLSIAHTDGTLKNRFNGDFVDYKLRAKSGFLTGVVALAGYVWIQGDGYVPFALFYNGQGFEETATQLFDDIIRVLAN